MRKHGRACSTHPHPRHHAHIFASPSPPPPTRTTTLNIILLATTSELRNRAHKGGSMRDDQLSAAQLRARNGMKGNSPGWAEKGNGSNTMLLVIFAVVVVLGGVAFFMKNQI